MHVQLREYNQLVRRNYQVAPPPSPQLVVPSLSTALPESLNRLPFYPCNPPVLRSGLCPGFRFSRLPSIKNITSSETEGTKPLRPSLHNKGFN